MKITVIDTETTGVIPRDFQNLNECPYMLQLGSITYDTDSNEIINSINNIIKIPEHVQISKEVTEINSITKEMSDNGCDIKTILQTFNEHILESDLVVAHNLEFDINILNYEYMRNNIDFNYINHIGKDKSYCTMSNGTTLCKIKKENSRGSYYKWPKLEELHHHLFGKNLKNLHDAYNDLVVCLRCYMYMNFKIDVSDNNHELKTIINGLLDDK